MTATNYPDEQGYAFAFERAELTANRRITTAISSVQFAQPSTEGVVKGTRPYPLARTPGSMDIGTGTITFSDERERVAFIESLGDGYREVLWQLNWILSAPGSSEKIKYACISCRVLDNPVDHAMGEDALAGEMQFSFLRHTVNGLSPHPE